MSNSFYTNKGRSMVDFLVDRPILAKWGLHEDLSDEKIMFSGVIPS